MKKFLFEHTQHISFFCQAGASPFPGPHEPPVGTVDAQHARDGQSGRAGPRVPSPMQRAGGVGQV